MLKRKSRIEKTHSINTSKLNVVANGTLVNA